MRWQGIESALAHIYDTYAKPIYRYHHSRVSNAPDAEDLTSQTFMAVIEALPRYQHRDQLHSVDLSDRPQQGRWITFAEIMA